MGLLVYHVGCRNHCSCYKTSAPGVFREWQTAVDLHTRMSKSCFFLEGETAIGATNCGNACKQAAVAHQSTMKNDNGDTGKTPTVKEKTDECPSSPSMCVRILSPKRQSLPKIVSRSLQLYGGLPSAFCYWGLFMMISVLCNSWVACIIASFSGALLRRFAFLRIVNTSDISSALPFKLESVLCYHRYPRCAFCLLSRS